MILLAASAFFTVGAEVTELEQAQNLLSPLLGSHAAFVFAVALLFSGISSTITSGMAAGSVFAGFFGEPFDIKDNHSRLGVTISIVLALVIIFFITNAFDGLIYSQMILSIQLPITIFLQIYLTSSRKVMGKYANGTLFKTVLITIGTIVTALNIMLLISFLF